MIVPSHAELLEAIDAFQVRHPDIKDARFGREATGEPGLVAGLRKGRSPTLNLLERLAGYMKAKDAEVGDNGAHNGIDCTLGGDASSGTSANLSQQAAA